MAQTSVAANPRAAAPPEPDPGDPAPTQLQLDNMVLRAHGEPEVEVEDP